MGVKIQFMKADITEMAVDAIVNIERAPCCPGRGQVTGYRVQVIGHKCGRSGLFCPL